MGIKKSISMVKSIKFLDKINLQKYIYLIRVYLSNEITASCFVKYFLQIRREDTYWLTSFGLSGLWNACLDPKEQLVGTYRINVYNFSGNTLWFVLTNQTSMNSFLYDLGPSWQRSSWGPGGNMNQTYIWSEPVRK